MVIFMPRPLCPFGNSPRYSLDGCRGGPEAVWTLRKKGTPSTCQELKPGPLVIQPVCNLVTEPTEVSLLVEAVSKWDSRYTVYAST